jgi:ubiquinone/menaquinone biosynthesis C-methylase UbiE
MTESRREFFDRIATQWDGFVDLTEMAKTLRAGLRELNLTPSSTVVDLGCGTGNLTSALLERLDSTGRVLAVDFSPHMLRQAQRKVDDERATWLVADATELPIKAASADFVICFSAWPHFPQPQRVLAEALRVLGPGGTLHIWHAASRVTINQIHAEAGQAVEHDRLAPAETLAALAAECGLEPYEVVDDDERYVVRARVPAPRRG